MGWIIKIGSYTTSERYVSTRSDMFRAIDEAAKKYKSTFFDTPQYLMVEPAYVVKNNGKKERK